MRLKTILNTKLKDIYLILFILQRRLGPKVLLKSIGTVTRKRLTKRRLSICYIVPHARKKRLTSERIISLSREYKGVSNPLNTKRVYYITPTVNPEL